MSIAGLGTDIVSVERIKHVLKKHPSFLNRILAEEEIKNMVIKHERVAGYFAAKEAFSKSLGTGIGKISWHNIIIIHDELGKPEIKVKGAAKDILDQRKIQKIHLSISHERQFATATVILEDSV